ncbi:UNVERIFIED_CONTAM: amino acid/polyamine/organocation transporter (APC superfamily) [Acetivibrio alkalicellulosi]
MKELKKTISLWKGLALAVSMIIGSGLLGLPGISLEVGNVYSAAGGWIITSISAIPLIYIFSYLGMKFTSSAGISKYAQEAVGKGGAYAVSIVLCGTLTLGIPTMALIGGSYMQKLFMLPENSIAWLAIASLALMTIGNIFGVKVTNAINTASFIALVSMVLIIIFSNISFLNKGIIVFGEFIIGKGYINYTDLWRTSAILFWAFLGWENLSFGLEEFKNPKKTIPRVYWLSYVIVISLYLALAATSIGAQVSGISVEGASGLASLMNHTPIGFVLTLFMVLVILANLNAWMFGFSRSVYSSGRVGILPSYLGRLSKKNVPVNSLITLFIVYVLIIILTIYVKQLSMSTLILLVNQNFVVLYGFSIFAYWKTENKPIRWLVTILAACSFGFFISGFNWWVFYPIILLGLGYFIYYRVSKMNNLINNEQV